MTKLRISIMLNILFILAAVFFAVKRYKFNYDLDHPKKTVSFLDNPQYIEQTKIMSAYHLQSKVVLLGNSHIYKAHWNELLNRGDVGNRGIGSDITEGYLHRLQYVFDCHPAVCFIEGGINDIEHHIPEDKIVNNLSRIADTLRSAGIVPVLTTVFHVSPAAEAATFYNDRVSSLNLLIKDLAKQKHLNCIDLNPSIAPENELLPEFSQHDGVHLTGKAYEIWARAIDSTLITLHL
ncbi:MAG TPA: GDSL-type esterase/lipase family protein [Puia sp.]|jgi:lysophospholipase L1-like esterase